MSCCGARPSAEPHPNASRFERGSAPHQEFWEVHLEGCNLCQRWSTLALEYEFARLTAPKQQRAKRSERPRCSRKTHKTEAAAEAERAKLIATKQGLGFVEKPKEIPCAPPPRPCGLDRKRHASSIHSSRAPSIRLALWLAPACVSRLRATHTHMYRFRGESGHGVNSSSG